MTQAISQSNQDSIQDSMVTPAHMATLAAATVSTGAIIEAAVMHAVLLSCATIASRQDADLNSTKMASTSASSEETSDNNASQANQSSNANSGNNSINSLFQDKTDPMQADYNQYIAISEALSQKEDLLQKLIALSYEMKNSFLICELLYNALGDVKGEQSAQYGAINNLDTALGNTNANAQNELNEAVKYLEGIVNPTNNPGAYQISLVSWDLFKLTQDANGVPNPQIFGSDWLKMEADLKNANFPKDVSERIQDQMNTLTTDYNNVLNSNFSTASTEAFTLNAMDVLNNINSGNGISPNIMNDMKNITEDFENQNYQQAITDLNTLSTDVTNDPNLSAAAKNQLLGSHGEIAVTIAELKQGGSYPIEYAITFLSQIGQSIYFNGAYNQQTPPPNPPPPPPIDPSKVDPHLQAMCTYLDNLEQFIKTHSALFGNGGAQTIIEQIETIKNTFNSSGTTWGNGTSMRQEIDTWLQNVNQKGIAPQQLQTLSGALQSIDRATDAQSTSSRMTADFDLNQVKQILGGQESFVQAPLQAENGFVRNQKAQ